MDTLQARCIPLQEKLDSIFKLIESFNMTPKSFLAAFLDQSMDSVAYRRGFWGTEAGWSSTWNLLLSIRWLLFEHLGGKAYWEDFILSQVPSWISLVDVIFLIDVPSNIVGHLDCAQRKAYQWLVSSWIIHQFSRHNRGLLH